MTEVSRGFSKVTPLVERHRALGARLIDFAGWLMPVQYSGIIEEHRAVRERAGLFDLSHMGELFVEGPEAGAALAAALVSNPPPSPSAGPLLDDLRPDGGILDDLIVYRRSPRTGSSSSRTSSNASAPSADTLTERLSGASKAISRRPVARRQPSSPSRALPRGP